MARKTWLRRILAWIAILSLGMATPPRPAETAVPDLAATMAETLIGALNQRDWARVLAVAIESRFTSVVGDEYALERLERSRAEF